LGAALNDSDILAQQVRDDISRSAVGDGVPFGFSVHLQLWDITSLESVVRASCGRRTNRSVDHDR